MFALIWYSFFFCLKLSSRLIEGLKRDSGDSAPCILLHTQCTQSAHIQYFSEYLLPSLLKKWERGIARINPDYSTFQFRWNWKLANSIWQLYRWLVCEIAIFKWFAHTLRCHGNKEISCWLVENWGFLPFFVTRKMKLVTYIAIFVSTQMVALIYFVTQQLLKF